MTDEWDAVWDEPPRADLADLGLDALPSSDALAAALRAIGERRYHARHPFHRLLHEGALSRGQVQAWALNRYYYQSRIPIEGLRADGPHHGPGAARRVGAARGRPRRLARGPRRRRPLARAVRGAPASTPADVAAERGILPATRHAGDAYVRYVAERPLIQAVASSLTELFAPSIIRDRVAGMLANYDFVDEGALSYFRPRLDQAPRDARLRPRLGVGARDHAAAAPGGLRRAPVQVRRAVGPARRACTTHTSRAPASPRAASCPTTPHGRPAA